MSAPPPAGQFQDHYSILGIAPTATLDTIHKAYSALVGKYHPRNPETRDQAKYEAVTQAYEVLSDAEARRTFDELMPKAANDDAPTFSGRPFFESISGENCRRLTLLCLLYDKRRQNPASPTLLLRNIESMVLFPSVAVQLALWYLKQRGLVISDDKSSLQITADGMEYLEANMLAPEVVYSQLKPAAVGCRRSRSRRQSPRSAPISPISASTLASGKPASIST